MNSTKTDTKETFGSYLRFLLNEYGQTAKSQETADKAKGLQAWIAAHQKDYPYQIVGGIVMERYPNWLLNTAEQYVYEEDAQWYELRFDND